MARVRNNQGHRNKILSVFMRPYLEQERTQEKEAFDQAREIIKPLQDKTWQLAKEIVRRHYTPVPLGYVSPAHCSSTLKPSGNCLPVHQGLRVINSVLEPRSLHKEYRILTGSAQGSGLKGALNYWSVKKNNSHAPIGIRILFQNHPNTVKPNTK